MKSISLNNIGIVRGELTKNDYDYLLRECSNIKKAKKFVSGLSDDGVAKHYYISNKKALNIINDYAKRSMYFYYEKYPGYLDSQNQLDVGLPLELGNVWVNHQKPGEFIPLHDHDGIYSFNIWIKIPYDSLNKKFAGNFAYSYRNILGQNFYHNINLTSKDEGSIILFPSKLQHLVYPFYNSKKIRISIAGNLNFSTKNQ